MNNQPKVSIIVPTQSSRSKYYNNLLLMFKDQDYENKELIPVYGEGTIGEKLNTGCASATGDIILRWDDDDLYARNWTTKSVEALIASGAPVTGLDRAYFCNYVPQAMISDIYSHYNGGAPVVCGATMAFWKSTWERCKFREQSRGEDGLFCTDAGGAIPHSYSEGFIAILHGGNTCSHENMIYMRKLPEEEKRILLSGSAGEVYKQFGYDSFANCNEFDDHLIKQNAQK